MTRALAVADRIGPVPGDLPEFDEDARHRRLIMARVNGVDPRFCDVIDRIASGADLDVIVRAAFDAHRAAERVMVALTRYRARAAATAARELKNLDLAIDALRPAGEYDPDVIADDAIGGIVGALRGIAAPSLALDRSGLVMALLAERARYAEAARLLDGRGRPPSRLRTFADQLLPIFVRHARPERRDRSDFRGFVCEAARLVTGAEPGSALTKRVARDVLK